MTNRVGQQFGNYSLTRLLGDGGFAEVYLGEHKELGTQVAIKMLKASLSASEVQNFRIEATTIAKLIHPYIVRVFDFGIRGNTPFMVMDYAPNGTLEQQHPIGMPVPLNTIVSYVKQVAEALQYAHDTKIIHRDVKPGNMLIGQRNEILLSDFGIAVIAHSTHSMILQDKAGTLAYMAPEQLQGQPVVASDQYALGIVVYAWLCGEVPFNGTVLEMLTQHLSVAPPLLRPKVPTISATVEQVVLKALAKDPKQRFANIQEFADALEQASQSGQATTVVLPPTTLISPQYAPTQPALPSHSRGTLLCTYRKQNSKVIAISWSPDGQFVASLGNNNSVHVWNATSENTIITYQISSTQIFLEILSVLGMPPPRTLNFIAMKWSPNKSNIAIASNKGTKGIVEVWNATTQSKIALSRHSENISRFTWSPDGKRFFVSISEGIMKPYSYYDPKSYQNVTKEMRDSIPDKVLEVWDIAQRKLVFRHDTNHSETGFPPYAIWSPNGHLLLFASHFSGVNTDLVMWNVASKGKPVTYYHPNRVTAVGWSSNERHFATGSADGTIRIWDTVTENCVSIYKGHSARVNVIAWSPDGASIASTDGGKTIQVWNVNTGNVLCIYKEHSVDVYDISWLPDGQHILSKANKQRQIWNIISAKTIFTASNTPFSDNTVAELSPDRTRVAFVDKDRALQLWEANTGSSHTLSYLDHGTFEWSPDGTRIASIALDGIVRIWQAV